MYAIILIFHAGVDPGFQEGGSLCLDTYTNLLTDFQISECFIEAFSHNFIIDYIIGFIIDYTMITSVIGLPSKIVTNSNENTIINGDFLTIQIHVLMSIKW